jgi:hypothetical protein
MMHLRKHNVLYITDLFSYLQMNGKVDNEKWTLTVL